MKVLLPEVPNKLNKLVNKQLRCCKQLLELSKKQKEAIQSDEPEIITKTVSEKEKLIEEFRNIQSNFLYKRNFDQRNERIFENLSSKLNHSPQISNLLKEIDLVLEELRLIEGECEEALSRRCTEIEEEIDGTKRSRAILNRFSSRPKTPQFSGTIDEKA